MNANVPKWRCLTASGVEQPGFQAYLAFVAVYFFRRICSTEPILSLNLPPESNLLDTQLTDILQLTLTRSAGRFNLVVGDQEFKQTTCEFLLTFASMQGKNMEEYLTNLTTEYDHVRVPLSGCGRSVTLMLADFARLRTLYGQRMFELKLEDLLVRHGITPSEHVSRQYA